MGGILLIGILLILLVIGLLLGFQKDTADYNEEKQIAEDANVLICHNLKEDSYYLINWNNFMGVVKFTQDNLNIIKSEKHANLRYNGKVFTNEGKVYYSIEGESLLTAKEITKEEYYNFIKKHFGVSTRMIDEEIV